MKADFTKIFIDGYFTVKIMPLPHSRGAHLIPDVLASNKMISFSDLFTIIIYLFLFLRVVKNNIFNQFFIYYVSTTHQFTHNYSGLHKDILINS